MTAIIKVRRLNWKRGVGMGGSPTATLLEKSVPAEPIEATLTEFVRIQMASRIAAWIDSHFHGLSLKRRSEADAKYNRRDEDACEAPASA